MSVMTSLNTVLINELARFLKDAFKLSHKMCKKRLLFKSKKSLFVASTITYFMWSFENAIEL